MDAMLTRESFVRASLRTVLPYFVFPLLCLLLASCNISITVPGSSSPVTGTGTDTGSCQSNCSLGTGIRGVSIYVEPDDGESVITGAIRGAHKSIWLEIYILSDRNVIKALEDAANNGIDVRIMLEPHPYGGGVSASRTLDQLKAAGIKAQYTSPSFALTHEKGMIIDGTTVYIMTSNFSRAALGGYSGGNSSNTNREYGIIDTNALDVRAVTAIFNADWNRATAQFNDPNLVVSPVNSRHAFLSLIGSAHHTLLIDAEEMNDSAIESALASASQHGVRVEVILPSSSSSSNGPGIATIKQGGVQVRADPQLYMHAKIIVVDGSEAFVGSENFSTQSLDQNRELGIIISDPGVLNKLQSTFQADWNVSRAA